MLHESEQNSLRWQLTMLHRLLEEIGEVDPETKEAMNLVATDLSRVLDSKQKEEGEGKGDESDEEQEWPQLGKRWQEAVLDFESQHPRLAQAVDEISAILANAGI